MFPFKPAFPSASEPPNLHPANFPIENSQWMNQASYQNVDLESVDWAALAQQWIYMKESCTGLPAAQPIPIAPPPPMISKPSGRHSFVEKGEAPMEVEPLDEIAATSPPPAPAPPKIFSSSSSSTSQSHHRSHSKNWHKSKDLISFFRQAMGVMYHFDCREPSME